MIQPFMAHIL